MSVRRAQQEVSGPEFAEWMAYETLEPFGPDVQDLRFGILGSLIANVFAGKGRSAKAEDFMLGKRQRRREQQSVAEMKHNLGMYLQAAGVEPKVGTAEKE